MSEIPTIPVSTISRNGNLLIAAGSGCGKTTLVSEILACSTGIPLVFVGQQRDFNQLQTTHDFANAYITSHPHADDLSALMGMMESAPTENRADEAANARDALIRSLDEPFANPFEVWSKAINETADIAGQKLIVVDEITRFDYPANLFAGMMRKAKSAGITTVLAVSKAIEDTYGTWFPTRFVGPHLGRQDIESFLPARHITEGPLDGVDLHEVVKTLRRGQFLLLHTNKSDSPTIVQTQRPSG